MKDNLFDSYLNEKLESRKDARTERLSGKYRMNLDLDKHSF